MHIYIRIFIIHNTGYKSSENNVGSKDPREVNISYFYRDVDKSFS
jgi:hypothetical protein